MVSNYMETKMCWRHHRVSNTCSPCSEATARCLRDVCDSRDGSRAHARAVLQVQSRDVSTHCSTCSASGGGARPADLTYGAMTARRFYEPFFTEPRCSFSDGRTNERSLLSASRCRERMLQKCLENMQRRLRPTHKSKTAVLLQLLKGLQGNNESRIEYFSTSYKISV